jgi:hypothetical protein
VRGYWWNSSTLSYEAIYVGQDMGWTFNPHLALLRKEFGKAENYMTGKYE